MKNLRSLRTYIELILGMCMLCTACDKASEPTPDPIPESNDKVSEAIIGRWLQSLSDNDEWIIYEFSGTTVTEERYLKNEVYNLKGHYFTNDETGSVTSRLVDVSGVSENIDWKVRKYQSYQLDVAMYTGQDGNTYAGDMSLYKLMETVDINLGETKTPSYHLISGTNQCTNFTTTAPSVVEVDAESGEIKALKVGTAFVVFNTPAGHAAIRINIAETLKRLDEYILGEWAVFNPTFVMEKDMFGSNGYFYSEWRYQDTMNGSDSATGSYTVDEANSIIKINGKTPSNQRLNSEMRIKTRQTYSFNADIYSGGDKVGEFLYMKIVESLVLKPGESSIPDYNMLLNNIEPIAFSSCHENIANVDETTGAITAVSSGRTYIRVKTPAGTAAIEVSIEEDLFPIAFEHLIGKNAQWIHSRLGDNPSSENDEFIIYNKFSSKIDMIGVSMDTWSSTVKGVVVTYNSTVQPSYITATLDASFIPYMNQTTEIYKAYMDTERRADASFGITWDIPTLTLTYVNLFDDLFKDYSVLINLNKSQAQTKMGVNPDLSENGSDSWVIKDKNGVKFVSAFYYDSTFTHILETIQSVSVQLDDNLSNEDIISYLKRKYVYHPNMSDEIEYVFSSEDQSMVVCFSTETRLVLYMDRANQSETQTMRVVKQKAKTCFSKIQ